MEVERKLQIQSFTQNFIFHIINSCESFYLNTLVLICDDKMETAEDETRRLKEIVVKILQSLYSIYSVFNVTIDNIERKDKGLVVSGVYTSEWVEPEHWFNFSMELDERLRVLKYSRKVLSKRGSI